MCISCYPIYAMYSKCFSLNRVVKETGMIIPELIYLSKFDETGSGHVF